MSPCTIKWEDSSQIFLTFLCTSLLAGYEPTPLLCIKYYSYPYYFPYYLFAPAFTMYVWPVPECAHPHMCQLPQVGNPEILIANSDRCCQDKATS